MTDAELIRAVQAGDAAALEEVYRRYFPLVWRYAYSQFRGDISCAEDVTSETFLGALRSIWTIDPEQGSLGGWLLGIARHKAADVRRSARNRYRTLEAHAAQTPEQHCQPSAHLERGEVRTAVARTIESLAEDERLVLEWKYLDGLSVREIAGRLGRTEKATEALLYRARRSFRKLGRKRGLAL